MATFLVPFLATFLATFLGPAFLATFLEIFLETAFLACTFLGAATAGAVFFLATRAIQSG